jgi:hypothetical protein
MGGHQQAQMYQMADRLDFDIDAKLERAIHRARRVPGVIEAFRRTATVGERNLLEHEAPRSCEGLMSYCRAPPTLSARCSQAGPDRPSTSALGQLLSQSIS